MSSVPKGKRKLSTLEYIHHFYSLRKEFEDLLLRDFGYHHEKAMTKLKADFGMRPYESLSDSEKQSYDNRLARTMAYKSWFIEYERTNIQTLLSEINTQLHIIYSMSPSCELELSERRVHIEKAIGYCYSLASELQMIIETLPVKKKQFTRFAELLDKQISLLKGMRKANNNLRKGFPV